MSNNQSRRRLLKTIAAGSGAVVAGKSLPESWSKPVIDTVVLPSHASTTDDSGSQGGENTTPAPATTQPPCIIEGEYCFVDKQSSPGHVSIVVSSDGSIEITRINEKTNPHVWKGSGNTSGDPDGNFEITVYRDKDNKPTYVYTGTVVCGSVSISGSWSKYLASGAFDTSADYTATQAACEVPD